MRSDYHLSEYSYFFALLNKRGKNSCLDVIFLTNIVTWGSRIDSGGVA